MGNRQQLIDAAHIHRTLCQGAEDPDEAHNHKAMADACEAGSEALELLDWYNRNPYAIGWARGLGEQSGQGNWTCRVGPLKRSSDCKDLIDAIRQAKKASEKNDKRKTG